MYFQEFLLKSTVIFEFERRPEWDVRRPHYDVGEIGNWSPYKDVRRPIKDVRRPFGDGTSVYGRLRILHTLKMVEVQIFVETSNSLLKRPFKNTAAPVRTSAARCDEFEAAPEFENVEDDTLRQMAVPVRNVEEAAPAVRAEASLKEAPAPKLPPPAQIMSGEQIERMRLTLRHFHSEHAMVVLPETDKGKRKVLCQLYSSCYGRQTLRKKFEVNSPKKKQRDAGVVRCSGCNANLHPECFVLFHSMMFGIPCIFTETA